MPRYIHTIFCDDIRDEIRNKTSLMGIYEGDLIVPRIPCVIPKLCAAIFVSSPISQPFSKIAIRALLGKTELAKVDIPELPPPSADDTKKGSVLQARLHLVLTPVEIKKPDTIRIRITLDDSREYRAGGLRINVAKPPG